MIRRRKIDQVHCARCLPEGWIAWLLKKRHRLSYYCYAHGEELHYGIASRELGWMMRRVLRGAELVVANSQNTAGILQSQWSVPAERIRVLHPGVDAQRFVPDERQSTVRATLGWNDRPVVLTVGRLQRRKGHDMLIRALPKVRERVPDVLYAIVGDGDQQSYLQQLVRETQLHDHVQFLGEISDERLVQCYQQCDLFVLPNRDDRGDIEGFGMVLLEAQACGRPVLAGQSGGTGETMQVGRTGMLVPCETPWPLADAVTDLLLDAPRRAAMGRAAREWIEERFDWNALARQAYSIFRGDTDRLPQAVRSGGIPLHA